MKLSYVIVTRNRRDTLLRTLARLYRDTGLSEGMWETFVVDNGSEDGTAEAVARHFRQVQVIRLAENEGVPARNRALSRVQGRYVCFLDDDSYPLGKAIPRAIAYLNRHPHTAALVARVLLPTGEAEAPAFPTVTLGGASLIRKSVLSEVGGFAPEFFRQAEEYDLSFRIWRAGHIIERFEDLFFGHDKVPGGRSSALTRRMDLRNNLIVAERFLPRELRRAYRHDWMRRYAALGTHEGHADVVNAAIKEARIWARREAAVGRKTLDAKSIESIFQLDAQSQAIAAWSRAYGIRRICLADIGKNIYATWRGSRAVGLEILAVLDNAPAFARLSYRGIPVLPDAKMAGRDGLEGIVLSNVNPAQVDRRIEQLSARFKVPILRLWEPKTLDTPPVPAEDGTWTPPDLPDVGAAA